MPPVVLGEIPTLVLAILAIFLGRAVNGWLPWLGRASIPPAVTGGALVCAVIGLAGLCGAPELAFGTAARGALLLIFFASIGMTARLRMLAGGGLGLLAIAACVLLMLLAQNAIGVGLARAFGQPAALGLFAGSIPFVGGHGTAAAWAGTAAAGALPDALALGLACATFGLILGGLVGGPVAGWLASRARDAGAAAAPVEAAPPPVAARHSEWQPTDRWLASILCILGAMLIGEGVVWLGACCGATIPGFLGAMLGGALLTNACDLLRRPLDDASVDVIGTVALRVFLALSLIGLKLGAVAGVLPLVAVAVVVQTAVVAAIAAMLLFPLLGRGRDAAACAGGFIGFGLGATPVAMAVMRRVESRYGAVPRAILLITLAVSFLVDPLNALVLGGAFALLAG